MSEYSQDQLVEARNQHKAWLTSQPGVTGVGIGMNSGGQAVVKVFSNQMSAAKRNEIVERFGTVPVEIEETGEISAQPY